MDKKKDARKRETDCEKNKQSYVQTEERKKNQDGHDTTTLTYDLGQWENFNSLDLIWHCHIINDINFIMDVMIIMK